MGRLRIFLAALLSAAILGLVAAPAASAHYPWAGQSLDLTYQTQNYRCGNGDLWKCMDRNAALYVIGNTGYHSKITYYEWVEANIWGNWRNCRAEWRIYQPPDEYWNGVKLRQNPVVAEKWWGEDCYRTSPF